MLGHTIRALEPFCRLCVVLLVCGGCRYVETPTAPGPVSATPSSTSSSTNTNTNGVTVIVIVPTSTPPPSTPADPPVDPPPGSSTTREPDPLPGQSLPLPSYTAVVVAETHASNPSLILNSCVATVGSTGWQFLDKVIDHLRMRDTRWGYACQATNGAGCDQPSPEMIAYHATAGPDIAGAQGIITVDVIENYCTTPALGYINRGFDAVGRWATRGRF